MEYMEAKQMCIRKNVNGWKENQHMHTMKDANFCIKTILVRYYRWILLRHKWRYGIYALWHILYKEVFYNEKSIK